MKFKPSLPSVFTGSKSPSRAMWFWSNLGMNEKFQTVEKICRVCQIHTHRKGSETGNTTSEEKSDEDLRDGALGYLGFGRLRRKIGKIRLSTLI